MYIRSIFSKLNNCGYSDEQIEDVKTFMPNNKYPDPTDTIQQKRRLIKEVFHHVFFLSGDDKLFCKILDVLPNNKINIFLTR